MALGFYDLVIGFDELEKRAWIFSNGFPEQDQIKREVRAKERLNELLNKIMHVSELSLFESTSIPEKNIQSNFTVEKYQDAVRQVMEYILAGDIFEANISQRFRVDLPPNFNTFYLYQTLRKRNPAPFAAYMHLADTVIVSASP